MANLFPTPFPADLPENWTQGQTVSPNGTEVGLTQQYGYNYLMQLVNSLASGLNEVDSNALLTSLGTIPIANGGTGENTLSNFVNYKGRIEVNSLSQIRETGLYLIYGVAYDDYPTNSGNFAIMTVYQAANYVYQTVYGAFTNNNSIAVNYRFINTNTEVIVGWNENVNTVNLPTLMQSALKSGGVSVVKSVQRGIISMGQRTSVKTVTINKVNTNKAIVIYTGATIADSAANMWPYLELTNSTTVTATRLGNPVNDDQITTVPYQVIEYY